MTSVQTVIVRAAIIKFTEQAANPSFWLFSIPQNFSSPDTDLKTSEGKAFIP
jgi:hypothetical protein